MIDVLKGFCKHLFHCHQFYELLVLLLQHRRGFASSGAEVASTCVFKSVEAAFRNPAFIHLA